MKHELQLFLTALQFLTRIPVPSWVGYEPSWLNASARHFPAVGLLVGMVAALAWCGAHALFPAAVAAWLSLAATVLLTGAFHEDGFADTCDGLGGGADRERALAIMKDSRIGAYGAIGLVVMLATKAATLAALPVVSGAAALLFAHTASRTAAVALIRFLPYAGDTARAKAKPLAQRISSAGFIVACGWSLMVALVAMWWWGAHVMLSAAIGTLAAWCCARWWRRRLGGITGDTLGATQQIAELSMLLAWLAVSAWR